MLTVLICSVLAKSKLTTYVSPLYPPIHKPTVVAIMRSLEAQDLVSPRLRNTFWYTYPTWQMVDERLQVGLLQELKRLLSLHANPDEIPLFFRCVLVCHSLSSTEEMGKVVRCGQTLSLIHI